MKLKLLQAMDGHLLCVRSIRSTGTGRCIITAQKEQGINAREEITYEAPDLLSSPIGTSPPVYEIAKTDDLRWSPLILVPRRMTEDFTGRENELSALSDWANDTDSRACMLWGDGGIGKTTLAVEFIHRLLEGKLQVDWRPDVITFFTAKQTRWGLNGLERISFHEVGLSDVAHTIVRALEGDALSREWYVRDTDRIISKLSGYLSEWGVKRDSHLLVLDNTETLAQGRPEVEALAAQIRQLSRRVGRVLVTSRRREPIEARQIEVKPWSTEESVAFLEARAKALNRVQLLQAGRSTLRKFAEKLENKPLVLEVFLQSLAERDLSLQKAFERVMQKQRRELGEFLYSDAWKRLGTDMQALLLLMTRVADVHDEVLLKLCCMEIGITITQAHEALQESRGIATLQNIGNHLQITFTRAFLEYCNERTVRFHGKQFPSDDAITRVRNKHRGFVRGQATRIRDRVSRAYRHPLARAAWNAAREERFDECEQFYELAVAADSDNGWLYDRYAYFLFKQRKYESALERAKQAVKLIPNDPDSWFTKGTIEARLGMLGDSLNSLEHAEKNGKPQHLCKLQAAYAFINCERPDQQAILELIAESERTVPREDPYRAKHLEELRRLRKRARYLQ